LKAQLDEEILIKLELQKTVTRINNELQTWRSKYENEGLARADDLEETRKRLTAKLAEAEEKLEETTTKYYNLEKSKSRLQNEKDDLLVVNEKLNANSFALDKKQKQFDKLIAESKHKCDALTADLELTQRDSRQFSTEIFKLRTIIDENTASFETLKRENSNLNSEIKELKNQLNNGGKNYNDTQKTINRLEEEKKDLQNQLEDTELALEQEEAKFSRLLNELNIAKAETDKRLKDKDEEFENTR